MPEIIPAIIAKNFDELAEKIKLVEPYVKTVQLDVMDGVFVSNKTWNNPADLKNLETNLFLEAHLMTVEPEKVINDWLASKVGRIVVHYEAAVAHFCHSGLDPESRFNKKDMDSGFRQNDNKREVESKIFDLIKSVRAVGKEMGVALNPETPIGVLDGFISEIDLALLMSVKPGLAGQEFLPETINKIKALRRKYPSVKIEVDGGINLENAKEIIAAGADFLAIGSTIWQSDDFEKIIQELKNF